jgi:hypothetical protein
MLTKASNYWPGNTMEEAQSRPKATRLVNLARAAHYSTAKRFALRLSLLVLPAFAGAQDVRVIIDGDTIKLDGMTYRKWVYR